MNHNKPLQQKITALMEERYRDPKAFETFAAELMHLGITRLTYDALKDDMSFYTTDAFIHSLKRTDLTDAQKQSPWTLGKRLNIDKLEKSIAALDAGKMPATEFHREIFAAGVIFCNVYLTLRKIYYMGCDGEYYLEQY